MNTSGELIYLRDVLGIKSFLLPHEPAQDSGSDSQSVAAESALSVSLSISGEGRKNAVFLRQKNAHSFFSGDFFELTQKILLGVKLSTEDVWLVESEHSSIGLNDLLRQLPRETQNLQILVMGEMDLRTDPHAHFQVFKSLDPARILHEPEMKREFWEQLKRFLVGLAN